MQLCIVYFICKLLYIFRMVSPPINRSTNNCICSIWYQSTVADTCRYCGGFEIDVIVEELSLSLNSSTTAKSSSNVWVVPDAVDTVICASGVGWRNHPKHVEQFADQIKCVQLHLFGHLLIQNTLMFVEISVFLSLNRIIRIIQEKL